MADPQATSAPTLTDILFERSADGLCVVAPEGTVVRANAEWLRITGLTEEQVVGEDIIELFPATRDVAFAMHARARAGHRVEVSRHAQVVNGRETWWEHSIEPVPMEGGTGLLVTLRAVRDAPAALAGADALPVDEATLRGILNATRESIWLFSAGGVALAANETALARWRRPREEILGRCITAYTPGPLGEARLARIEAVVHCGQPLDFEDERDGIRYEHTLYPVLGAGGRVERVAVFSRDVTQRLNERRLAEEVLRESEERLRHTLAYASAGVWEWEAASGRLFSSPENYALYGVDPAEALDFVRWGKCLHPDDFTPTMAALQDVLEGRSGEYRSEFRVLHPARGTRWILGVGRVEQGPDGRVRRLRGLNLDITERKRAEEELRLADQRKTEFLSVLSHELRNPLAPIRHSIYLLERSPPDSAQASRAKLIIHRQTEQLTRLVDDLLDLTRISRGKMTLVRERLDLRELVRKTTDDLHGLFEEEGVDLRFDSTELAPVWIDADATRVSQIIGNLLQNAAKFTPSGGAVTVVLVTSAAHAEIRVRDTGIGMDPATVERMFEPFAQAEQSLARMSGGLGLGLALVKGITEMHGGTVRAESAGSGCGSEFVVRLPVVTGGVVRNRASGVPRRSTRRHRVLVVDDNRDAAEALAEIVSLSGHAAEIARDGPSAIERAREGRLDIVLCDIGLPGMSGYDVARALRAQGRAVQLFAISGYAQPEDVKRAIEAGFDGHVAKPCDPEEIERLLS